ncbi:hypothetical protein B9Z55_020615 [Caenorhabditis nigoni]|nr:hypothetical protein B9Z55_020615 [Caenorhabditis nigoni]
MAKLNIWHSLGSSPVTAMSKRHRVRSPQPLSPPQLSLPLQPDLARLLRSQLRRLHHQLLQEALILKAQLLLPQARQAPQLLRNPPSENLQLDLPLNLPFNLRLLGLQVQLEHQAVLQLNQVPLWRPPVGLNFSGNYQDLGFVSLEDLKALQFLSNTYFSSLV